jgi:hypothetical protein
MANSPKTDAEAVAVLAQAAGAFVAQNQRMTDAERKAIEKEVLGLVARLRWTHLAPGARHMYELRLEELRAKLAGG